MKINVTIEIDDEELKGLISKKEGPKVENYTEVKDWEGRRKALSLLVNLQDIAEQYTFVTVADYYDLIGKTPCYTDHRRGWSAETIFTEAKIEHDSGRNYRVKLPEPIELS